MPLGKKAVVTGIKGVGFFKKNYPNLYKSLSPKTLIEYKKHLHTKIPNKAIQQRLGMMDMIAKTEGDMSLYKAIEGDGFSLLKHGGSFPGMKATKTIPSNIGLKGMSIPKDQIKKPSLEKEFAQAFKKMIAEREKVLATPNPPYVGNNFVLRQIDKAPKNNPVRVRVKATGKEGDALGLQIKTNKILVVYDKRKGPGSLQVFNSLDDIEIIRRTKPHIPLQTEVEILEEAHKQGKLLGRLRDINLPKAKPTLKIVPSKKVFARTPSKKKYDFGGGEYPRGKDYTVVDSMPKKEFKKEFEEWAIEDNVYSGKYIQGDITKPLKLSPGEEINMGRVLRYALGKEEGFLTGDAVKLHKIKQVVQNIDNSLKSGKIVRIYDHPQVAEPVIKELEKKGYTLIKKNVMQFADKDFPAEWEYILRKGKTFGKKLLIPATIGTGAIASQTLQPNTAEAGIKSKALKLGTKKLGKLSSAHLKLKGANIKGRVVEAIHKGRGNNRTIVFTDGTYLIVDKKYITSASASIGREKYIKHFEAEGAVGKTRQATKSLLQRRAIAAKPKSSSQIRSQASEYQRNIQELELKPVTKRNVLVNFNNRNFSIPEDYALHLEKKLKGELSILTKQPVSPIQEPAGIKMDALKEIQKRLKGNK